ncbi:fungal-specific transcription factor domain-containing protein [Crassisporium funariophilum]|nr:fungal-specific transcription factor domain-containing protein [Crassisporium funariophilum]
MPQASRKDVPTQRAQDKESKRARGTFKYITSCASAYLSLGALSCAECRRLKLKCDKTVPCSSCKRRGCSAICPNGSLITGQGTRFVLADTEKLHQKIANMSDRIRQLEDALAILQSSGSGPSGEPHPLLHRDLLKIKSSIELHSATLGGPGEDGGDGEEGNEEDGEQYIDAFGTLAIRDDGAATFYGRSAGSEVRHSSYPHLQSNASTYNGHPGSYQDGTDTPLPSTITTLAASFPLSPSMPILPDSNSSPFAHQPPPVQGSPITLQTLTSYFLPPYAEALRLTQLYLEQAPWFFGAVTSRQIEQELLPLWYEEAATVASTPPSRNGAVSIASGSPSLAGGALGDNPNRAGTSHDLALLFVLFCFGSLTDTNLLSPPDNAHAERFYQLTKASLTLDPAGGTDGKQSRNGILERPPSVATVQALSLMAIYEGMCSGENSIESTWALMGLACKLAQSVSIFPHRDCARWKLTPAEVQKRRALFWELFITDCWQSLATGRIATFSLPFVDCELPFDPDQTMADDGSVQPSFPFWKARFGAECVSAVVQGTLTSRAPKYSIILDLDRKVRDMELPLYAQGPPPQGLGLAQTMSHFMPTNYRELTLLYIHRCFFAHAISSNPLDPIKSQYAPSFLAGYRSACTIVASVRQQFALFPAQIARFWVLWTHAFSASVSLDHCVMLASVATHSSRSKVAPAALLELKNACDLFESASGYGGRAIKFLPILRRLQMKAQQAYRDANSGLPASIPNDIFKPSQAEDQKDELSIFSGKTHTVSTKSAVSSTNPSSNVTPPSTSRGSGKNIRSSSDSPQQMFTDNPSFAGVHPSLVSELNVFHGHIKAQIQNAYRAGGEVFGGGPMMVDAIHRMPPGQQQQVQHQQQVPVHQLQQQMQMAQQQQHQQALYQQAQQQQLKQQMEIQRQQRAQEQEIQRQQELQRQQQQELIKQQQQQQQLEHRRQQEKHQQLQRQEEYRQQLENQQRQLQQQHTMSQYRQHSYNHEQQHPPPIVTALNYEVPASSHPSQVAPITAPAHPQRHLSHSHSLSNMQHTYQQQYQHIPHDSVQIQHTIQGSHQQQQQQIPQQHSMYAVPPETSHYPTPESMRASSSMHSSSASSVNHTPPASAYGQTSIPPTPVSASYVPDTYKYWPAASSSFAMPDQQPHTYATAPPQMQRHQLYTPENALRGIAAEDHSLQETWQSYMNKVCVAPVTFAILKSSFPMILLGWFSTPIPRGLIHFKNPDRFYIYNRFVALLSCSS